MGKSSKKSNQVVAEKPAGSTEFVEEVGEAEISRLTASKLIVRLSFFLFFSIS